jgi:hypothetical protein
MPALVIDAGPVIDVAPRFFLTRCIAYTWPDGHIESRALLTLYRFVAGA